MAFELTILGSNSALPAHGRHPTSQILNIHDHLFMIDCGEAAQIQIAKYKIKHGKIDHVFISHLHGDHYFGLIGMITSYSLNQRSVPLTIVGPAGLEEIINVQLKYSGTTLSYPLIFMPFEPKHGHVVYEDDRVVVTSLALNHRIPCSGFIFKEKPRDRNIRKEKLEEHQIPVTEILAIKRGADFRKPDGTVVSNEELLLPQAHLRSYAYCTDTLYNEEIIPYITGADLLYHEATFDHSRLDRAIETYHTTATQAGQIAKMANVKRLVIGHFSSRYRDHDLEELVNETRQVFPNADLATEGRVFVVGE